MKFLNFLVGGSRSQGFQKYLNLVYLAESTEPRTFLGKRKNTQKLLALRKRQGNPKKKKQGKEDQGIVLSGVNGRKEGRKEGMKEGSKEGRTTATF